MTTLIKIEVHGNSHTFFGPRYEMNRVVDAPPSAAIPALSHVLDALEAWQPPEPAYHWLGREAEGKHD